MKNKLKLSLGLTVAVIAAACITINVYFPEAAVKELSEQIEDEVARRAAEEGAATPAVEATPSPTPTAANNEDLLSFVLSFGARTAYAADEIPNPGISNPAIRKLIDSRATRLSGLNDLKDSGVVGESNRALLEIRNLDNLASLKDRAAAQRLVKEENADREQLFKEIAAAQEVDLDQLDRIRQTYAETIRAKARPGDWIQMPDDSWRQKVADEGSAQK